MLQMQWGSEHKALTLTQALVAAAISGFPVHILLGHQSQLQLEKILQIQRFMTIHRCVCPGNDGKFVN